MAAAADAPDVKNAIITVSKKINTTLVILAPLITMCKMDRTRDTARSLYSALNLMNCSKEGRVSLVVPMAIALPKRNTNMVFILGKNSVNFELYNQESTIKTNESKLNN
uniref:Uncharacterized protein n=1 Tax=Solanum lycopersicum TaxID=4081 RepID=A0A3Q7FB50_SOLLC